MNSHEEVRSNSIKSLEKLDVKNDENEILDNVDNDDIKLETQNKLGSHCYIGPHIKVEKKSLSFYFMRFVLNVCCCGCRSKKNRNKEKLF